MRVLGIDPGLRETGYGLLEGEAGRYWHLTHGTISVPASLDFAQRLQRIYGGVAEVIEREQPEVVALEQVFYARNVKVALQLGHARAAALLPAAQKQIAVVQYSATEVKMAVAGYGRADKQQVGRMVAAILGLAEPPQPEHAADALAVALCHLHTNRQLMVLARR